MNRKDKKPRHLRTPRQTTALVLGLLALLLCVAGVSALLLYAYTAAQIFAGAAMAAAVVSVLISRYGLLPAVIGFLTGGVTMLSAAASKMLSPF